jgi:hypothetical protein
MRDTQDESDESDERDEREVMLQSESEIVLSDMELSVSSESVSKSSSMIPCLNPTYHQEK